MINITNITGVNASGESSNMHEKNDNEEEEEDEVIKAILKSKELARDHPPIISLEDPLADICFHPTKDIIALASVTGDVLM